MTALPLTATCFRVPIGAAGVTFADLAPREPLELAQPAPSPLHVAPPSGGLAESPGGESGAVPVPPAVRQTALLFARAIVEGLGGRRSAAQFGDLVAQRVLSVLAARAHADRNRVPFPPASLRLQLVSPVALAVTLRLAREGRSTAAAFRLDRRRGRWRCTALVVGP